MKKVSLLSGNRAFIGQYYINPSQVFQSITLLKNVLPISPFLSLLLRRGEPHGNSFLNALSLCGMLEAE
jgi:hypothetical protein